MSDKRRQPDFGLPQTADDQQGRDSALTSTPLSTERETGEPIIKIHASLFAHGKERAKKSKALKARDKDITALTEHARRMAQEAIGDGKYNPQKNAHDRIREDDYQKHLEDRRELEERIKHTEADLREGEREAATVHVGDPPPTAPAGLEYIGALVIAASAAPTIRDLLIATVADNITAWAIAVAAGAVVGYLICWALLGSQTGLHVKPIQRAGLIGGIGIGLALLLVRLAAAHGQGEYLLAFGLSGVEIGACIIIEGVAKATRLAMADYLARLSKHEEFLARVAAIRKELGTLEGKLEDENAAIESHEAYVRSREERHLRGGALEAAAIEACLDGYSAGIAENAGRITGAKGEED